MGTNGGNLKKLSDEINKWVKYFLGDYRPKRIKGNKIIKDPVWGMTVFSPIEINLIDSPIFQRLRRIHQTGLIFLIYPSAFHTRFDHSLGMLHCATKIVSSINERYSSRMSPRPFEPKDIQEIRIAAILHDIGHACLSHLTESYFDDHPLIKFSLKELIDSKNVLPSNHELISSLIVSCPSFIEFFSDCTKINHPGAIMDAEDSLKRIADMIIGFSINGNPEESYKTEIVNGPYDADKLDYIFRDSYFTGISLSTDIEKFIFGLSVAKVPQTGKKSIVLDVNAASTYDQLVFSKVALYVNVFNHQKAMAANLLVDNILEIMKNNPELTIKNVTLTDPINFLNLTDWDLLNGETDNVEIRKIQKKIEIRDLPVRLFRISKKTVIGEQFSSQFLRVLQEKHEREKLGDLICRGLKIGTTGPSAIRIGIPYPIFSKEKVEAYCKHFDNDIVPFSAVFPLEWIKSYDTNKWVAYAFGLPSLAKRENYGEIKSLLESELNMTFNEKSKPKLD